MVAIVSTSPAVRARASRRASFCSRAATFTASSRFWLSLEAAPSVPRATTIPAARNTGTGQTPEAWNMLATGLCTAATPALASAATSAWSIQMQWAASTGTSSSPASADRSTALRP
jgi:hypothetical protein